MCVISISVNVIIVECYFLEGLNMTLKDKVWQTCVGFDCERVTVFIAR